MNENIKAGADIHAGDGGYSEGTQEGYDAFVKVRNKSLAQARIRDLAEQAGYLPDSFGIGHWDMPECKKFAELIVMECCDLIQKEGNNMVPGYLMRLTVPTEIDLIKKHFGVE